MCAKLLLNVLDGCTAALQALDALHSIDGFLVEHPAVAAVTLTGQQPPVRIEPQRMLRDMEQPRHLPDGINDRTSNFLLTSCYTNSLKS